MNTLKTQQGIKQRLQQYKYKGNKDYPEAEHGHSIPFLKTLL
jgi:hypothetical protein